MTPMLQQLEWEEECIKRGHQRYLDKQHTVRDKGVELSDAGNYVLKDRIDQIAEALREDCRKGRGKAGAYNKLVRHAAGEEEDYHKIAFIAVKFLLMKIIRGKKVKVTKTVSAIGSVLEAELKCKMFHASEPAYFETVMDSFKTQGVVSGVHKQKVLMKKFNDFDLEWTPWTTQMKVQVGSRVFRALLKGMGDIFYMQKNMSRGKTDLFIDSTDEFNKWVEVFENTRGLLLPVRLPLKCPPPAWGVGEHKGGYFTPDLKIPFIKVWSKDARAYTRQHEPAHHKKAINKLQRTAWQINHDVLRVQEQVYRQNLKVGIPDSQPLKMVSFPDHLDAIPKEHYTEDQAAEVIAWKALMKFQHGEERKRKGQVLGFRQVHLLAQELRDWDSFYYAYNCDFRGRIYCATAGLSPQGSDTAKGLIRFARSVPLGTSGIKWLAIHGANVYGEDKLTYPARVAWVKSNEDLIRGIVSDPLSNLQWADADKPYQFLAFCFEWARSDYGRDPKAKGHLPVGLDGSCNGLQHYSAMLRDEVGAQATNLCIPDDDNAVPQDIYGEVAKVCTAKLAEIANSSSDDAGLAGVWLRVGVNRKTAKRPVMTLPYGATQTSARQYILEYVSDNWSKFNLADDQKWVLAKFLTPILWQSIGEVVVAARAAMSWLQKQTGKEFCSWLTPLGFPVYQHYLINNLVVVNTFIEGRLQLRCPDMGKGDPYRAGQRNGVAPNFVHSIDSTHMVMTINDSEFNSYAMIHDDFGTHAGNTDILFRTIRTSFKKMYSMSNPLEEWAKQQGVELDLPMGKYNLDDILKATYFFG